jgi:hypothetical protein
MTDFLAWGASWLTEMSNEHASIEVVCSWTADRTEVSETVDHVNVVDEAGNMIRAATNARVENTYFMFNQSDIDSLNIPLISGLRIQWGEALYEVVKVGNRTYFYNDTYRNKVVVPTKHVKNVSN